MSVSKTWDTTTEWQEWVNESDPTGSQDLIRRTYSGSLKIPLNSIDLSSPLGTETVIARWKFGQTQSLEDQENTNDSSIPSGSLANLVENGILFSNKNAYLSVDEVSSFPTSTGVASHTIAIACWFKSNTTDYSTGDALIVGLNDDNNDIEYGIAVTSEGKIVGKYYNGSSVIDVSPQNGDIYIDTEWHNAFLFLAETGGGGVAPFFFVDNEDVVGFNANTYASVSGTKNFTIGAIETSTANGFSGTVDEVVLYDASGLNLGSLSDQYRLSSVAYLSPIIDTGENDNILLSMIVNYSQPTGSRLRFSFRASNTSFDQDDTSLVWSGFTAPDQFISGVQADIEDIGVFTKGRYMQIRVRMDSSDIDNGEDALQLNSPSLDYLQINTSKSSDLVNPAKSTFFPGEMLTQIAEFSGNKTLHKISIEVSIEASEAKSEIEGKAGVVSFAAANFQESRNNFVWQPVVHWADSNNWSTNSTTIENLFQSTSYTSVSDAIVNAPFLTYELLFPDGGFYELWGYGYTASDDNLYYSFDGDITHLRKLELGSGNSGFAGIPYWTKFGSVFFAEGGRHIFTVYLGQADQVRIDQWYFTKHQDTDTLLSLDSNAGYQQPLPLSKGPFNTILRVNELDNGGLLDLNNPSSGLGIVSSWRSSIDQRASTKFNYEIQELESGSGVVFSNGISLDFWQIGGSRNHYAAWRFNFVDDSQGNAYKSTDFGQTKTIL